MIVLVIVLVVTNLATLAFLGYLYLMPEDGPEPDDTIAAALDRSPRPPALVGDTRRMISIEILNPIELAGTRGRLAGIAGSLVPGITRRIVYDQTLKILRQQLVDQQVVADVRVHTLRPVVPEAPPRSAERDAPARTVTPERPRSDRPDDRRADDRRADIRRPGPGTRPAAPSMDVPASAADATDPTPDTVPGPVLDTAVTPLPEAQRDDHRAGQPHRSRRSHGRRHHRPREQRPEDVSYVDDVEKVDLDELPDDPDA